MGTKRAIFQLENNKLNVNFYHLIKALTKFEQSKEKPIQYAIEREIDQENKADEKLNSKPLSMMKIKRKSKSMIL